MRWVNDTLPPVVRLRCMLIMVRWSITSFIGTVRTDVAVGTSSDWSMFFAVRRGAPRRVLRFGSSTWAVCASIVSPASSPVAGSTGPCPATKMKSPTRRAGE